MDFRGRVLLAPLTKGGNLPFRRLCLAHGCTVTMGEMAYAYQVVRRSKSELALLRKHAEETCFGAQIAANRPADAIAAGLAAVERGASWVDLNCGCPIHEATRRGLGSALLRSPRKLSRLVAGIAEGSPLPLTVKIRLGVTDSSANYDVMVPALVAAGAAAVTIHGRSGEGRYKKAADWGAIERVATSLNMMSSDSSSSLPPPPIIGNGDVLTYFEAQQRLRTPGVSAVMIGRGALIRPWIFAEVRSGREWLPDAGERVTRIYRRLVACYQVRGKTF